VRLCRPTVPEEAGGDEDVSGDHWPEPEFGFERLVSTFAACSHDVSGGSGDEDALVESTRGLFGKGTKHTKDGADTIAQVSQASQPGREVIFIIKHIG
jgi:hypothetical protein